MAVDKEKVRLSLGEEIERFGAVSDVHVAAAAKAVRKLAKRARLHSVESLDVFLTAPGRQSANADELVNALTRAAGAPVRVLSTDEEGRLAYGGAVATAPIELPSPHRGLRRRRSVDGDRDRLALRTSRLAGVGRPRLGSAHDAGRLAPPRRGPRHRRRSEHLDPLPVDAALAVGGSARAARRLVGYHLGADELAEALFLVENESERSIVRRFDVDPSRARILPAGIVLLAEVQQLLGVPLHVCNGGIREGAVLEYAAARAA